MRIYFAVVMCLCGVRLANAQPRPYVGLLGGVSTLSADARAAPDAASAAASSYQPANGPTVDVYAGVHWTNYFSLQADYLWNRNRLTLDSLIAGTGLYERPFQSHQHAAFGNALLYFRPRSSWVRPFLAAGGGWVHAAASPDGEGIVRGLSPPGRFQASKPALHIAVGIDLKLRDGWGFRYSFAETTSSNPISRQLTPPGSRMLSNFRNLFGVVKYF